MPRAVILRKSRRPVDRAKSLFAILFVAGSKAARPVFRPSFALDGSGGRAQFFRKAMTGGMPLHFEKTKKEGASLVLKKRVPVSLDGERCVYFMTNDYAALCEKLFSLGCRNPEPKDFVENPALARNVRKKMEELGVSWSLLLSTESSVLNYYEAKTDSPYILYLESLFKNKAENSILKIFNLALENDGEKITAFAKAGGDIELQIQRGATPLMIACSSNSRNSVKSLMENSADVNARDANEQTPLMYTAFENSAGAAAVLLLDKSVQLEARDCMGQTALFKAAAYNAKDVLKALAKAGADVNAANYAGETPLYRSVVNGLASAASFLIDIGADANIPNNMGRTPLIAAAAFNDIFLFKKLLNAGADASACDVNGDSALCAAAKNGSANCIRALFEKQAIPGEECERAVIHAAARGSVEGLYALLECGSHGEDALLAALLSASLKDKSDIIHVCVDFGCDIDQGLYFGITALMAACHSGSINAAAQLLACDADVNKADDDGMTALMYAASKNRPAIVRMLLENGADASAADKNGKTFEDFTKEYDARTFRQMVLERAEARLLAETPRRADNIPAGRQSFRERFKCYYDNFFKRHPAAKNDAAIYKAAGISKQSFAKIQKAVNMGKNPDYRPHKETVLALTIGLRLTANESDDLMRSAGYAFEKNDKTGMEIKNLMSEGIHDIFKWNERIFAKTGKVLFKTITILDDDEDEALPLKGERNGKRR